MGRYHNSANLLIFPVDPQPSRVYNIRERSSNARIPLEYFESLRTKKPISAFVVATHYAKPIEGIDCPVGKVGDTIVHNREKRTITLARVLRKKDIQPANRPRIPKNPWCWLVYLSPRP